jgi:GNAT superfamily N-acetyltransferase
VTSAALVRPYATRDADAAAALVAAEWPHRASEAEQLRRGELDPEAKRWAAADPLGGGPVAYAALWRVRGDRFRMDLLVAPEWRRRGIGEEMLRRVLAAAEGEGAATLQARAYESAEDAIGFLHRRGFAATMRMVGLALDLRTIDPDRLAAYERAAIGQGFAITTLADEQRRDPASLHRLNELYDAAREGWPDPDPRPDPPEPIGYDAFLRLLDEFPTDAESFFIARVGDRYVGFTGSLGTAVHPAFRGRGLATALKARLALHACEIGRTLLETSTGHPAMLRANETIGFRRTYTEVRLVRRIQ